MQQPWYHEGLRFECTQCGGCCAGEPGFVWVNQAEVEAMAQAMQMELEAFRDKFTRRVGSRTSLVEYPDGDCIFLDPQTRGCLVYAARPTQCRTWPFWGSNLKTREDWHETCAVCPGAGTGQLYDITHIETARKQKRV
jgi:Fe-S-cluster containining protein